jgi:hypothetical protein
MSQWPQKPFIYQINTWVWLSSLSQRYNQPITLANIPQEVFNELGQLNVDVIWLMGIWQRRPASRASALNYKHEYVSALPDLTDGDVIGSAYAIGAYEVDSRIGSRQSLADVRAKFAEQGLKLILDYVPNHVATDHDWVLNNPEYMIYTTPEHYQQHPDWFFKMEDQAGIEHIIAHGRDPNFAGWIDTAQVNAYSTAYRQQAINTLTDILSQCDGVRCDMAMLMTNDIFARTWGSVLDIPAPETDFWDEVIPQVKQQYPDSVFIAEVYWDMEYLMLQQGFDFTYDKRLYDRVVEGFVHLIHAHLLADVNYQSRQVRFIENHDEPRAASTLGADRQQIGAILIATLPGAVLLHDGQFTGRKAKLPVQIKRQPDEPIDTDLQTFYQSLLAETRHPIYQNGKWRLFDVGAAYLTNSTYRHLLAYGWMDGEELRVIIVNITPTPSRGMVHLRGWECDFIRHNNWCLIDLLSDLRTQQNGAQMIDNGLYVELGAYQAHLFRFEKQ